MGKPLRKAVDKVSSWSSLGILDGSVGLEMVAPKEQKEAQVADPLVAPIPDDAESAKADSRRRQRAQRSGRTSTVLSGDSNLG